MSVWITGLGLWTARHPSAAAWRVGDPSSAPANPRGLGIPPRARRRATPIARMAADALDEALRQAGRAGDEVDLLLASVGGELANTVATLRLLGEDPPASSPLRFGASVHNAALGQLAIPWDNRRFASALAARDDRIVATGWTEAACRVLGGTGDAAVVFADEVWPVEKTPAAAVAVVMSARPGPGALARVDGPVRARCGPADCSVDDPAAKACPVRGALWLADAVWRGYRGAVCVGAPDDEGLAWTLTVGAP